MSTQPGDSQKSLLKWEVGCHDFLFDSASDLMQCAGATEAYMDAKGRGALLCTEESIAAIGCPDGWRAVKSPHLSIDSDGLLCPSPHDQAIRPHGHGSHTYTDPSFYPTPAWGPEISRKLDDAALFMSDVSSRQLLQVSGPPSLGTMGRSRERRPTAVRGTLPVEMPIPEPSAGSDVQPTSPSQLTTPAGSSIQTSTQSEVDGHGFIILEGSFYDRLPPFVHIDPPRDRRAHRRNGKWRRMLEDAEDNWAEICQLHSKLLKKRIRKGIPKDWRYRAWPLLSGGRTLQQNNPNLYARLLRSHCDVEDRIMRDVHRTMPTHILFAESGGAGQRSLFNCLKAYAVYDPEVGYCQGMGSLVAALLTVMSEEDAFWTFAAMMREEAPFPRPTTAGPHVGCRRLFLEGLPLTHELASKLEHLVREKMPRLHRRLHDHEISYATFTSKWWMTVFCFALPFEHALRVWDVFLLEGWKMALRTGLAILKCMESRLMRAENENEIFSMLQPSSIARSLPPPDDFITMVLSMRITKKLDTWNGYQAEA